MKIFARPYLLILFIVLAAAAPLKGQLPVKRLNDPSIVAMEKRRVFSSWGEFYPYPKYVLGVQTNLAYATVWGMWSPKRNQDYRSGKDIRPLGPQGEQTQRHGLQALEEKRTQEIKRYSDSLEAASEKELLQVLPEAFMATPLYLLYYRPALKPLKEMPLHPQSPSDWFFPAGRGMENLMKSGRHEVLMEELSVLKDRLALCESALVTRGERLLMLHGLFMEYRKFQKKLYHLSAAENHRSASLEKSRMDPRPGNSSGTYFSRSDLEIVRSVLRSFKPSAL